MTEPEHLQVITTDRGFDHLPPIPSRNGGTIRVYESSAASVPSLWLLATAPANLNEPDGPTVEAPMHLDVDDAWKLAEQIVLLARNHYQVKYEPAGPVVTALADTRTKGVAEGWQQAIGALRDDGWHGFLAWWMRDHPDEHFPPQHIIAIAQYLDTVAPTAEEAGRG